MKRIVSLFLALVTVALLVSSGVQSAAASQWMPGNGKPYYIMVNRAQSTVTVYELDERGYYTVPVKAMICSTGRKGHATPTGTYTIGGRWSWVHMLDNSYGQYCTQISGNILFHSVCYTKRDPSTLITSEYNGLGAPASLGCVRLQTIDAKWIYDNCARGTKVTIYDDADSPGPLGKPTTLVGYISDTQANGWDPTDPRENNPWHKILAANAQEPVPSASAEPTAAPTPKPTLAPSTKPSATPAPTPAPTPTPIPQPPEEERVSYAQVCQALYKLSGGTKITHPSQAVTWGVQRRLLDNLVNGGFDPYSSITRQEMAYMFYQYETQYCRRTARNFSSLTRYSDWTSIHLYARDAMRWSIGNVLIQPMTDTTLQPNSYATQAQLDAALTRYQQLH